jgi:large subunit ribosomal protein L9
MEIILKQDVENLGFKDDLVKVKPGYGRNYLIPKGFGILATEGAKKMLTETLRQRAHKEAKIVAEAREIAEKLQKLELKIAVTVGKGSKLFGSISNANLAEEISKNAQVDVDRKFITIIGGTVKSIGKYTAKIRLHREVVLDFGFEVVAKQA